MFVALCLLQQCVWVGKLNSSNDNSLDSDDVAVIIVRKKGRGRLHTRYSLALQHSHPLV